MGITTITTTTCAGTSARAEEVAPGEGCRLRARARLIVWVRVRFEAI